MFYEFIQNNKTKLVIGSILFLMAIVSLFFIFKKTEPVEKVEVFAIEADINTIGDARIEYNENYETTIYMSKKETFSLKSILENVKGKVTYSSTDTRRVNVLKDGIVVAENSGVAYIYAVLDDKKMISNYIKVVVE